MQNIEQNITMNYKFGSLHQYRTNSAETSVHDDIEPI